MTSPFSLPTEIVDGARQERSNRWLHDIAGDIDRQVSQGMRGLEQAASVAVEPLRPIQQALEQGGLQIPTLEDLTPKWMRDQYEPRARQAASTLASGITVPSLAELSPGGTPIRSPGEMAAPAQTGDLRAYTRQKAASLGIDPDIAERVAMSEGGFGDPVRQSNVIAPSGQRETSFGPFQLYVGGGLGDEAIRRGHDPRDPKNVYRNIDFALEHAASSGWGAFHGAARVGVGPRQGIGVRPPATASRAPAAMPQQASQAARPTTLQGITPPQFGLGDADAEAICGPVLAMAFARANGRNPTIAEAKQMAQQYGGWTNAQGMGGPEAMANTLRQMGIPATYHPGALDVETIRRETANGNPVGINTRDHYFVVEGVDEQGRLDLGNSAKALRASGGRQWFHPSEIASLGMGAPTGAIYKDAPSSPAPSVAVKETRMPPVNQAPAAPAPAPESALPPGIPPIPANRTDPVWVKGKYDSHWEERSYVERNPGDYQVVYDPKAGASDMSRLPLNPGETPGVPSREPAGVPPPPAGSSPLDDARTASYADQPLMQRNSLDPSAEAQADTYAPPQPVVPPGMMSPDPTDIRELTTPNVTITQGGPPNGPSVPLYSNEIPGPDLSPQGTPITAPQMAPSWTYDESPSAGLPEQGAVPPPSPYQPEQEASMVPAPTRFAPPPPPPVTAYPGEPDFAPSPQPATQTERALKPVWDAAGAVVGYVQEAAGKVEEARSNISTTLTDFGIGPAGMIPQRVLPRMEQIEAQAAREVGHDDSTYQGRLTRWRAVQDPGWRARNPELAEEYDRLERELGLTVMGQAGDAARISRIGQAVDVPPFRARPGNLPEEVTPSVIPPEVARSLGGPSRVEGDRYFREAVEATEGARIDTDGLHIDLRRFQKPEQAGQPSARTGVYYTPSETLARAYEGEADFGGSQAIRGETIIRRPLVVFGATGILENHLERVIEGGIRGASRALAEVRGLTQNTALREANPAEFERRLAEVLARNGGDPSAARALITSFPDADGLRLAASENLLAENARRRGHDAIVVYDDDYSGGYRQPRVMEVFDLREATYPTPEGGYTLRPEFQPAAQVPGVGQGATRGGQAVDDLPVPTAIEPPAPQMLGSGVVPATEAADEVAPPFFSQLRRTIEEKMPNRAAPAQIQGILKGSAVKPDEITWTGLDDWLREQRGPVTKQQVLDFLDQNEVRVEEVVKGEPLIRWRQQGDALVAAEAPTLRVVQAEDGTFRVEHDGRVSPVPFRTADEAKQAAQDIATDPAVGLVPQPGQTRYGQYALPGGENYRELLLTLPQKFDPNNIPEVKAARTRLEEIQRRLLAGEWNNGDLLAERTELEDVIGRVSANEGAQWRANNYRSSHWDEPNVLAHVRFTERTAPDGKRVLLLEEVQSDWHQAGRKSGYASDAADVERRMNEARAEQSLIWQETSGIGRDPTPEQAARLEELRRESEQLYVEMGRARSGVPDAPFKKTWPELAIKRMLRWAAENGFERVAWSPGAVHAERYSLGNQIDELRWFKSSDPYARGNVRLQGYKGGQQVVDRAASPDELPELVGQDVAQKITSGAETASTGVLRGADLMVGGQGMTGFYDQILPATVQKIGKRFGARVGRSDVLTQAERAELPEQGFAPRLPARSEQRQPVHSIDITPEMQASVLREGQPLFANFGPSSSPGLRPTLFNAAQGGALGAISEDLQAAQEGREADPQERMRRLLTGAALGVGAGRAARRGAGQALGSGMVPESGWTRYRPSGPPATPGGWTPEATAELADLARRVSEQKPTPRTSTVRRGGLDPKKLAEGIRESAEQGRVAIENEVGLPTPPPDAPPGFWDWANAWRYSVGLFGNVSTALVQGLGGAFEVAGGAPTELVRHALIRGRPESLPLIIGEAIKSIPAGVGAGLRTAGGQVPETILKSSDYRPPLSARTEGATRAAALAIETPGRVATQAPDAFWYEIFYRTGLAQAAAEEAQKATSRFNPLESIRLQRELIANPTPEVMSRAHQFAQDSTYKGELGAVLKAPEKLMRSGPTAYREAMSFLMPVYHTLGRIHEAALQHAPGVGMLPLEKVGLAAKGRPLDQKIAQQVVGLGLTAAALGYAAEGNIRGPGPSNPNELKAMRDQGYEPNTTRVGNLWVPNAYFGRFGPLLNTIGAYNDAVVYGKGDEPFSAARWDRKLAMVSNNFARAFSDYPFAEAVGTLIDVWGDPAGILAEFAGQAGAQFVPGAYRTYAGAHDPLLRSADRGRDVPPEQRAIDTFAQRSGLGRPNPIRQAASDAGLPMPADLPPAQDRFGRERPNPRQGWEVLFPRVGEDRPDPAEQMFIDAGVTLSDPKKEMSVEIAKGQTLPIPLGQREQDAWNRYRGEVLLQMATGYLESPAFAAAPRHVRKKELERIKGIAARSADERIKADIGAEDLRRRVREAIEARDRRAS